MKSDILKIETTEQFAEVIAHYRLLIEGDTTLKEHAKQITATKQKL